MYNSVPMQQQWPQQQWQPQQWPVGASNVHDVQHHCRHHMHVHVIVHTHDGHHFDGIIESMDDQGVIILVPEDMETEGMVQPQPQPRQFGFGGRRVFRRYLPRRFPFSFFAPPFFTPFPYFYPPTPFNPFFPY